MEEFQCFLDAEFCESGEKEFAAVLEFVEKDAIVRFIVGEVTAAAAGDEELLAYSWILFQEEYLYGSVFLSGFFSGSSGCHHSRRPAAYDDDIPGLFLGVLSGLFHRGILA